MLIDHAYMYEIVVLMLIHYTSAPPNVPEGDYATQGKFQFCREIKDTWNDRMHMYTYGIAFLFPFHTYIWNGAQFERYVLTRYKHIYTLVITCLVKIHYALTLVNVVYCIYTMYRCNQEIVDGIWALCWQYNTLKHPHSESS